MDGTVSTVLSETHETHHVSPYVPRMWDSSKPGEQVPLVDVELALLLPPTARNGQDLLVKLQSRIVRRDSSDAREELESFENDEEDLMQYLESVEVALDVNSVNCRLR